MSQFEKFEMDITCQHAMSAWLDEPKKFLGVKDKFWAGEGQYFFSKFLIKLVIICKKTYPEYKPTYVKYAQSSKCKYRACSSKKQLKKYIFWVGVSVKLFL